MAVKLEKSHKYLANGIYLLEQCKKSTVYLSDETNAQKLLAFLVRIYSHDAFRLCVLWLQIPSFNKYICLRCFTRNKKSLSVQPGGYENYKSHVSVLLRNDHKAQDIIAHIFRKIQDKLQKYLVFIDFFNKEMYNKCNVE